MSSRQEVVLVTGCSSGIGLAIAHNLYREKNFRAVVTARKQSIDRLLNAFQETDRFLVRELDVTDDENIYRLVNDVCCHWGRVDVIINNAAVCLRGVVEHMDSESELMQLKANYLGPMTLTRAVLPIMREQRSGQIINISSVSGILAMPTMGSYSASKHALEAATEALWYESRPSGIRVNLVELGFINSQSYSKVAFTNKARVSSDLNGPHVEYYRSMVPFIERLMGLSLNSPDRIARKIVHMLYTRPSSLRVSFTLDAIFFNILRRILPAGVLNQILFMLLPGSITWGGPWKARKKNLATPRPAENYD